MLVKHCCSSHPVDKGSLSNANPGHMTVCLCHRQRSSRYASVPSVVRLFVLFDLILSVPSTIFQLNRDGSSWFEPVLSQDKWVLFKDHNAETPVRLEPAAPRSRVKRSTTEPLRSHVGRLDGHQSIIMIILTHF